MNREQRKLLCERLKESGSRLKRGVDEELQEPRYRVQGSICFHDEDGDKPSDFPPSLRRDAKRLAKEHRRIVAEWGKLIDKAESPWEAYREKRSGAKKRVKDAIDGLIFKVQFAEDVEEARAILAELPTLEDVLKGL